MASGGFAHLVFLCSTVWCLTTVCWGDNGFVPNPDEDARLRQTTSIAFAPTPLGELLQKLSQQTGVTLRAERTVAEHRAILVVHEQPLHEILHRLAEAFDYRWRKVETKEKPPEYMLFQPAQQQAQQAAEIEELRRLRMAMLTGIPRRLHENLIEDPVAARAPFRGERQESRPRFQSRAEAINYLQEQAVRNAVASSQAWGVVQALSLLSEQDWQRLHQGEVFRFDTASPDSPLPSSVVDIARLEWAEQAQYEANMGLPADENRRQHYALDVQSALETDALPLLDIERSFAGVDVALSLRIEERTATGVDGGRIPPEVSQSLFRSETTAEEWASQLPEGERKRYLRRQHSFSASFSLVDRQGERQIGSIRWSRWVD